MNNYINLSTEKRQYFAIPIIYGYHNGSVVTDKPLVYLMPIYNGSDKFTIDILSHKDKIFENIEDSFEYYDGIVNFFDFTDLAKMLYENEKKNDNGQNAFNYNYIDKIMCIAGINAYHNIFQKDEDVTVFTATDIIEYLPEFSKQLNEYITCSFKYSFTPTEESENTNNEKLESIIKKCQHYKPTHDDGRYYNNRKYLDNVPLIYGYVNGIVDKNDPLVYLARQYNSPLEFTFRLNILNVMYSDLDWEDMSRDEERKKNKFDGVKNMPDRLYDIAIRPISNIQREVLNTSCGFSINEIKHLQKIIIPYYLKLKEIFPCELAD